MTSFSEVRGLNGVGSFRSGMDHKNFVARNANFINTDFSESMLVGGTFKNCAFVDANFDRAKVQSVLFEECRFYKTEFLNAEIDDITKLAYCEFSSCFFSGASLGCSFFRCTFDGSDFSRARLKDSVEFFEPTGDVWRTPSDYGVESGFRADNFLFFNRRTISGLKDEALVVIAGPDTEPRTMGTEKLRKLYVKMHRGFRNNNRAERDRVLEVLHGCDVMLETLEH